MSDRFLLDGHYYQYDLGWMIQKLMEFENSVQQIIDLQTIHYADPIQWDITTQYPPNTVVVDPKGGTAYMSKKAVPSGILLTNEEYWVVIFNYQEIYNKIMDGVAFNDRDSETATKDIPQYGLVWFQGELYQATRAIPTGTKYVEGKNLAPTTIEALLEEYYGKNRSAHVDNDTVTVSGDYTLTAGDIAETSTNRTEKITKDREVDIDGTDSLHVDGVTTINRGGAVTEVNGASVDRKTVGTYTEEFDNAVTNTYYGKYTRNLKTVDDWIAEKYSINGKKLGIYTDNPIAYRKPVALDTSYFSGIEWTDTDDNVYKVLVENAKTKVLDTFLPLPYASVVSYGADPTGETDSTEAIQKAIDSGAGLIVFPKGNYIANHIKIPSNTHLVGYGASLKCTSGNILMINNSDGTVGGWDANQNITIEGLDFWSDKENVACTLLAFAHCTNTRIINCSFHDIQIWHFIEINSCKNTLISGCVFYNYGVAGKNYTEMVQLDYASEVGVFPWFGPYDSTVNTDIVIVDCFFNGTKGLAGGNQYDVRCPAGIGNHTAGSGKIARVEIANCIFTDLASSAKFVCCTNLKLHDCITNNNVMGTFFNGYTYNLEIYNNRFIGDGNFRNVEHARGIDVRLGSGCENVSIHDNIVNEFGGHGITPQGRLVDINHNQVYHNGLHGIYLGFDNFGLNVQDNVAYSNNAIAESSTPRYDIMVAPKRTNLPTTSVIGDFVVANNKCNSFTTENGLSGDSNKSPIIIDQNFIKNTFNKSSATDVFKFGSNWVNFVKS